MKIPKFDFFDSLIRCIRSHKALLHHRFHLYCHGTTYRLFNMILPATRLSWTRHLPHDAHKHLDHCGGLIAAPGHRDIGRWPLVLHRPQVAWDHPHRLLGERPERHPLRCGPGMGLKITTTDSRTSVSTAKSSAPMGGRRTPVSMRRCRRAAPCWPVVHACNVSATAGKRVRNAHRMDRRGPPGQGCAHTPHGEWTALSPVHPRCGPYRLCGVVQPLLGGVPKGPAGVC